MRCGTCCQSDQIVNATTDIRSEIYSLGATLYFLLTGVELSPEALQRPPKLSRFPKPLRTLLARMLHRDPDQRPKDLVVLAEMIRGCLQKIERRRALADKYGIPYRTTIPQRAETRPARLPRIALAIAALLIAAAVIVGILLAEPIGKIVHRSRETKNIGVLVGVPESSPSPEAPQNVSSSIAPATVASQGTNAAVPYASQPPLNAETATNSPEVASPDQQTQTTNVQQQAAAPNASEASSPQAIPESSASFGTGTDSSAQARASAQAAAGTQPNPATQSSSHSKKKSVASTSTRARASQDLSEDLPRRRTGSVRGRVVGITSDGRLIFRLPSGRTAIVAPDEEEFLPRPRRRPMINRDEMFAPPPRFEPD
jgi:biotin protein ligase-like protein